jgi:hypothetical protein
MDRDQDQQRLQYREGWSSTAHAKANVFTGSCSVSLQSRLRGHHSLTLFIALPQNGTTDAGRGHPGKSSPA